MIRISKCAWFMGALLVAISVVATSGAVQDYDRVHAAGNRRRRSTDADTEPEIPLSLLLQLQELDDDAFLTSDLIEHNGNTTFDDDSTNSLARSAGSTIAKSAGCQPIETVVKLTKSNPSVKYVPECTLVMQCAGCCGSPLAKCQPIEMEQVTMHVRRFAHNSTTGKFIRLEDEPVIVDVHKKCACGCRKKESDCNRFQEYNQQECACRCTNMADHDACSQSKLKIWDSDTCKCNCRDSSTPCTNGWTFDDRKCECVQVSRSWWAKLKFW